MMRWTYTFKTDGFTFVPVTFPLTKPDGLLVEGPLADKCAEYIQRNDLKKAFLEQVDDYEFLEKCPSIEHIGIAIKWSESFREEARRMGHDTQKKVDLSPLYSMPNLKSVHIVNHEVEYVVPDIELDLSKLPKLEYYSGDYDFIINESEATSLKTLSLYGYTKRNLSSLNKLQELDTLQLTCSKISSLEGIGKLSKLKCLYLYYNRSLNDISHIANLQGSLKTIVIEKCAKIKDFSPLARMNNLAKLKLIGSNIIPSLNWISNLKSLNTFVFDVNVADGDLSPCMSVSCVCSLIDRKHYNMKDDDLPKERPAKGNSDVEEWRRLE